MLLSKKGAAILQVLLLAAVLAGIATMILRFAVSRTSSARQNRRLVAAQLAIESCMAEVNEIWVSKSPEAFERDWNECIFKCTSSDGKDNPNVRCRAEGKPHDIEEAHHTCERAFQYEGKTYSVQADIRPKSELEDGANCKIEYLVSGAANL